MRATLRASLGFVAALAALGLAAHLAIGISFLALAPTSRLNPSGELAPPTSGAVTMIALADVHARPAVLAAALEDARANHADAILVGGDLANQDSELEYRYGAWLLASAPEIPVFLAIGNHEGYDRESHLSTERFEHFFGPTVSWISVKGVLVVSINTSDERSFSEEQARRVDAILTERRGRAAHAVILTHVMPRFTTPLHDKRGFVKHLDEADSERLLALCTKHDVELVLGGHLHSYATETRGGTRLVIAGGGGGALDGADSFHHYIRLRFEERGVTHEVVRVESPFALEWLRYLELKYFVRVLAALVGALVLALTLRRVARPAKDAGADLPRQAA